MNEFSSFEAKIEESEKSRQLPGVEPWTPLALVTFLYFRLKTSKSILLFPA